MLTDIDINDNKLIEVQKKGKIKFYHLKYWKLGFTKVDNLSGDIQKIIGYIAKYMTKDIDNRLFGHRRYLYSRNLIMPKIEYLNTHNPKDLEHLLKILEKKVNIYSNSYKNTYNNDLIEFNEYCENTSKTTSDNA